MARTKAGFRIFLVFHKRERQSARRETTSRLLQTPTALLLSPNRSTTPCTTSRTAEHRAFRKGVEYKLTGRITDQVLERALL